MRQRKEYADALNWPVERVFCVPFNRHMASGNALKAKKFPRRIRVILKEIVRAELRAELKLRDMEAQGVKLNPTIKELRERLRDTARIEDGSTEEPKPRLRRTGVPNHAQPASTGSND
jgi:hypothetical protein